MLKEWQAFQGLAKAFAEADVCLRVAGLAGSSRPLVIAQLLLPAASSPLVERVTISGYFDYLAGTFDIIEALAIALLVLVAWRSAR